MSTLFAYDLTARNTLDFDSSAVETIAYNRKAKQLFIEFISGGQYVYDGVEESTYELFKESESLGRFYSNVFQTNFERVPTEPPFYLIAPVLDEPVLEADVVDLKPEQKWLTPRDIEDGLVLQSTNNLINDTLVPESRFEVVYDGIHGGATKEFSLVYNALSEADALARFEAGVEGFNTLTDDSFGITFKVKKVVHYID